jgi:KaiC/GvpD/RAD55 family RecA-like ATPase
VLEHVILSHLVLDEQYGRRVLPFLKEEYFHQKPDKLLYILIDKYVKKYGAFPSREALYVDLGSIDKIDDSIYKGAKAILDELEVDPATQVDWVVDQTEKFCQDKAIYNAIMASIGIIDDKTGKLSKGAIPQLLQDALAVSFNTNIGHDYLEDWEARFEYYHRIENKIPFDIEFFNTITKGGVSRKTLNIILAGTGVGKSMVMCHMAATNLSMGSNVLYITLEMAKEQIGKRIDANLLNVTMDDLDLIPKDVFAKKIARVKNKAKGKLIIAEYPPVSISTAHIRHLLQELKVKKKFVPDIIYVDYLNLCLSSRVKMGSNVNSYTYVKSVAEELRAIAVEYDLPVMSATQTNREGLNTSDVGLENTSESIGLPATADIMFALIKSEELAELGQIMVKQLKNRYADENILRTFVIGIDKNHMRLFDADDTAQEGIHDVAVMDNTDIMNEDGFAAPKIKRRSLKDFQ